jgi:hypothetical protein
VNRLVTLRWRRGIAVLFCALLGTAMPAVVGLVMGVPEPVIHDEFAYLLGADTFAHARLTNPSPPLPEFFEAPHVLVVPTYNSKYAPGQSMMLALGQALFGHPIWGVWLSCGLFAASLCWMLQAWTSRKWALAVTVMAIMTIGTTTYWAQSYWGGMLPAAGSALLFGGFRRAFRTPQPRSAIVMALGLLILANTRPLEGLLVAIPPGAVTMQRLLSKRSERQRTLNALVLPLCAVLVTGGLAMGFYNRAVTGHFTQTPYGLHSSQYFQDGLFLFSRPHAPTRTPPERIARFYESYRVPPAGRGALLLQALQNGVTRMVQSVFVPFGLVEAPRAGREPYRGVLLWFALLLPCLGVKVDRLFVVGTVSAVVVEGAAWWYLPAYPTVLMPIMLIVVAVAALTVPISATMWVQLAVAGLLSVAAGDALVRWWFSHYAAPAAPLALACVAITLRRAVARSNAPNWSRYLALTLAALSAAFLLTLGVLTTLALSHPAANAAKLDTPRAQILARLEGAGGYHLVFVEYDKTFSIHYELVYNGADLNGARILFAHDLGTEHNAALIRVLPGRTVWRARVSNERTELLPYASGPN